MMKNIITFNKIKLRIIILIAIVSLLSSCTKQNIGMVVGSLMGAGTGYLVSKDKNSKTKIVSILSGALAGEFIGGMVGNYMDKSDQEKVRMALQRTPTNNKYNWTNPKTGNSFTIQPITDFKTDSNGRYREAKVWGLKKGNRKPDVTTIKTYL